MNNLKYAVIGAGNGGKLLACLIKSKGHEVSLMDCNPKVIEEIKSWDGQLKVIGRVECEAKIEDLTTDLEAAVKGKDVIMVVTTADRQYELCLELGKIIEENQVVFLSPGQTGGVMEVASTLKKVSGKDITVGNVQDLIYGCRMKEPGVCNCAAAKKVMDFVAYPASKTEEVMEMVNDIFPMLRKAAGVLNIDFDNTSAMIHPAPTLLNVGRTENGEAYAYYAEGFTPSVVEILAAMDKERLAVAKAYGIDATSLEKWQETAYSVTGETLYDVFQNNEFYKPIKAAMTINNRFITEDVPCGLVPLTEYGKAAGVPTPVMDSIITIACTMMGVNYRETGRTLEKLGFSGMTPEEIVKKING